MIAWLKGVLRDKRPPRLLLDVHGVGYELEAPMTTFYRLPPAGEGTALFVHEVLREDARALYAFSTARDRDVFRLLLRVNGVGAKLALAVLSGMDSATLAQCVTQGDTQSLSRLPGIGKKTAERLVLDLRDRLAVLPPLGTLGAGGEPPVPAPPADAVSEAVDALIALGLKPAEASRRVRAAYTEDAGTEEIIRRALQSMVK